VTVPVATIEEVYRQHAESVFRFAMYLTADHAEAEDITAETFARALTSRAPIIATTAKGYLFAIARNLYLRSIRSNSRRVPLDTAAHWLTDSSVGVDVLSEHLDELRLVWRNLARLSEMDRSALLMRAIHELPYDEIARVLGVTTAAAKVKVHRARLRLAGLQGGN
jgi:RNA polymerase sigma-70 factor, ECF subfamily